ncbi:MAG: choline TMA-lyase-activating enzyme [Atopobium sp.]|uniref:choline TMA-lyase-activating enzyme n=1 Tax=Atopobium sp. TaxID=1872650 RepID=UPI002A7504B9|nr:choline TMA-lyase-activating enzyme [Atopobium sp.]MDY2788727.1 choline TMA-lyase-activating enzyme [Atopobium sp.]MDY4522410.1 choline TMA-lyase-activating enzyme [Atopobium sp.]
MEPQQEKIERKVRIFNLQKYNMYDGPGVRSMAFLKGCPLRCKWCSNPESQLREHEVMFKVDNCVDCGACAAVCPVSLHKMVDGKHVVDRTTRCIGCRQCEEACLHSALQIMGEDYSVDDLICFFEQDEDFYRMSDGGITLSGGEVLAQSEAALAVCMASQAKGYHTALETCGYTPVETLMKVAPYVNLFLYDIKQMDPVKHKFWTGVNNELILSNVKWLLENGYNVRVRMPLLKGVNDSKEEIDAVIAFFSPYRYQKNFDGVDLLPYHKLGVGKYKSLGREYEIEGDPSLTNDDLNRIETWIQTADFKVNLVRH